VTIRVAQLQLAPNAPLVQTWAARCSTMETFDSARHLPICVCPSYACGSAPTQTTHVSQSSSLAGFVLVYLVARGYETYQKRYPSPVQRDVLIRGHPGADLRASSTPAVTIFKDRRHALHCRCFLVSAVASAGNRAYRRATRALPFWKARRPRNVSHVAPADAVQPAPKSPDGSRKRCCLA
jgi:hypothetical protein